MTFAAVLCCVMTATVFTACGDDDTSYPATYRYEVRLEQGSVAYTQELQEVLAAFNHAVGADAYYQTKLKSPKDEEMKAECEVVRKRYENIQSAYMKFYLIRITATAEPGKEAKGDVIATYELGQALTTPYVTYSFASSEDVAYKALEAKKEELGDSLYKLNRRTLLKIVGRHTSYSTSQSLYEQTFSEVFGKYFKESQNDEEQIILHCEGIAETCSTEPLAVDVTVSVSKIGLLDKKETKIWEKTFKANM